MNINIKYGIVTLLLIVFSVQLNAQSLVLKGEIDLDPASLLKKIESKNIQFYTPGKKSIGKYQCFFIDEIIKDQFSKIEMGDYARIILIIESSDGSFQTATPADFDKDITPLMPVLIFDKKLGTVGDTVDIEEIDGKLDFARVDEEFKKRVNLRLHLQIKKISDTIKKRYFRNGSIIFPMDISTSRWITDAIKIRIYKFEI